MLKPRKRITRREIKEDPLVTRYFQARKFIQQYAKQIQYGVIGILLVILFGIMMSKNQQRSEANAAAQLVSAEMNYFSQNYNQAIPALIQVIDSYSGTKAAGTAVYYTANSYYAGGDFENAEIYFRTYLDEYSDNPLFTESSRAGVAACLENKEQYAEAAALYEQASKDNPGSFEAPFHLKNAARCYLLSGNSEKSKTLYQLILDKYLVNLDDSSLSELKREVELRVEAL